MAVVVDWLVDWSVPTSEICGLIPSISNFFFYLLCTLKKKKEDKEEEAGSGQSYEQTKQSKCHFDIFSSPH